MLIQPYRLDELQFAYCNRIYFGTHTCRRQPIKSLPSLTTQTLLELLEPYHLHLLEFASTPLEVTGLLSLQPSESISVALSKTKGRISKWISTYQDSTENSAYEKHLGKGYFSVTVGQPTTESIEAYLDKQAEHHGYSDRVRPPVWVQRFPHTKLDRQKTSDRPCSNPIEIPSCIRDSIQTRRFHGRSSPKFDPAMEVFIGEVFYRQGFLRPGSCPHCPLRSSNHCDQ